jgi:uncharacterized membrane protein
MANLTAENTPLLPAPRTAAARMLPFLVGGAALLAFGSWLLNTPEGVLGKADAIGYALCHRIDSHSLHLGGVFGDRPLPLCARCTGIYLGALLGMVTMAAMGRSRAGGLPRRPVLLALIGFVGVMGIDGVNSYLTFFPGLPHLYEPQNWLRVVTGTLNGLALAGLIYPILNQTLWRDWQDRPVLGNFRELGVLLVLAAGMIALVLTDNPIILLPLAVLSSVGVLAMVVALNTTIVLLVVRRENRVLSWTGAITPLLAGFTLAIIEIGLVDLVRYSVFGTWSGFGIPG